MRQTGTQRSRTLPHLSRLARAATAAALLAATPAANAEETRACAERSRVVAKLEQKFGETLRSLGLHRDDAVVEVYSSDETGTWTILMTRPDGMSCLLAAGQRWEQDIHPLKKPGGDA
jgi:predicted methyltransferase